MTSDEAADINTPTKSAASAARALDSAVWVMSSEMQVRNTAVSGVLNKVDTRAGNFGVTDSAGNDIWLSEVAIRETFGDGIEGLTEDEVEESLATL